MPPIALIEDDAVTCMLLGEVLTAAGYEVILIDGPGDPLVQLSTVRPDLVMLDLMLAAWGDGLALAGALRAHPMFAQVPVIIISAARNLLRHHTSELRDLRCQVALRPERPVCPR